MCDNCGTALRGPNGITEYKKDYIFIKGQVTFERFNHATKQREWVHITPEASAESALCDETCLKEWIETRVKGWDQGTVNRLRKEAADESTSGGGSRLRPNRPDRGSFVVGNN